ncbi:MAG TPA: tripartite tricarboxylate transporter substrate binding protein, partial [Xanthobacteraceae bacterium]|nr:tripartite tricarboxylate transporter substrate binding protein [Xanthobacteraceae bacterium]
AQYPTKYIKIVSPAPPGGGTDIIARGVQPILQNMLGQPVIVENRGGAGGYIGAEYTAKSPADGYTIVVSGAFITITASLHKVPGYNPRTDLVPVANFASVPNILVAGPRLKANSVAELIAQAKANPGKLNMGSNGVGTSLHLSGELFQLRSGVKFTHIAYRGWADAAAALTTGEVDLMFDNASTALPNIRAGKTRALAIAGPSRHRSLPDVPTLAEAGVTEAEVISWFGLMAPAGVPADVMSTLDKAMGEIAQNPEFRKSIQDQGLEVTYLNSKDATAFWIKEVDKWSGVIKAAGVKAE